MRRVGVTENVTACLVGGGRRVVVVAEGVPELDVRVLGSKNIVGRWGWGWGGGEGHRFLAEPRGVSLGGGFDGDGVGWLHWSVGSTVVKEASEARGTVGPSLVS